MLSIVESQRMLNLLETSTPQGTFCQILSFLAEFVLEIEMDFFGQVIGASIKEEVANMDVYLYETSELPAVEADDWLV